MAKIVAALMFLAQLFSCGMTPAIAVPLGDLRLQLPPTRNRIHDVVIRENASFGLDEEEQITTRTKRAFESLRKKQAESGYNDFTYEVVFIRFLDGNNPEGITGVAVRLIGREWKSSTPGQVLAEDEHRLSDEIRLNLQGYRVYLERTLGKGTASNLTLHTIIVERDGKVHFLIYDPEDKLKDLPTLPVSPPKPPTQIGPEHTPPPPQFGPPPASRPDHARAPSGARLNLW